MSVIVESFADVHKVLAVYIPTMGPHEAYRLDRMQPLMERLGNPQQKFRAIHVAGTSGKTSTCYYAASLLRESGAKVGLTVSPHVNEVNERVQINLTPLPEKVYCKLFGEFMGILEGLSVKPTYFELLVAFAYWVFAREGVEYAVIEVGLGGLLDSTNVITRPDKVCVLTDIGMDHVDILGRTLAKITAQKAGIIRPHNVVFMYSQGEPVMSVVREVCEQQHAELHEVAPSRKGVRSSTMPLFQRRNWYLAQVAVEYVIGQNAMHFSSGQLAHSKEIVVPGRMEIVKRGNKTLVLDGAHNPQKMRAFIKSLRHQFPNAKFAIMLAMIQSKGSHLEAVLSALQKASPHIIITSVGDGQESRPKTSLGPLKIAERSHMMGYDDWQVVADPSKALEVLLNRPEEILVVTGSVYLAGKTRTLLSLAS